jgi:hypothetical protein
MLGRREAHAVVSKFFGVKISSSAFGFRLAIQIALLMLAPTVVAQETTDLVQRGPESQRSWQFGGFAMGGSLPPMKCMVLITTTKS